MSNLFFAVSRSVVIAVAVTLIGSGAAGKTTYTKIKIAHDNYTRVALINNNGTVAGQYGNVASGPAFIRDPGGKFIVFSVDGAVTTIPRGLTDEGAIGGRYDLSDDSIHGFFRDAAGNLTTFDGPGLMTAEVNGMSANNEIVGTYFRNQQAMFGGFIRHPDGSFTLFHLRGARPEGLHVAGIDDQGDVAGDYTDSNFVTHAFLRKSTGKISKFRAPGASRSSFGEGTDVLAISSDGWITGLYSNRNGVHYYLRNPKGQFEEFDLPGGQTNQTNSVNDRGEVTGCYSANFRGHGFVRSPGGKVTTFDLPWGETENMCVESINNSGQVAGTAYYGGFGEKGFGFIRTP